VGYALNNPIPHAIENVVIGVARCLHLLNTADKCPINPRSVVPGWLGPLVCLFIVVESDGSIHGFLTDLEYTKPGSTESSSLTLVHNLSPPLMSCRVNERGQILCQDSETFFASHNLGLQVP